MYMRQKMDHFHPLVIQQAEKGERLPHAQKSDRFRLGADQPNFKKRFFFSVGNTQSSQKPKAVEVQIFVDSRYSNTGFQSHHPRVSSLPHEGHHLVNKHVQHQVVNTLVQHHLVNIIVQHLQGGATPFVEVLCCGINPTPVPAQRQSQPFGGRWR